MDYSYHYKKLCERAKNRTLDCYTEKHHVIPCCMGGTDDSENLVELTPEEHYVAHQLLVKIYPDHKGLIWAALMMTGHSTSNNRNNNKSYGWLKRKWQRTSKQRRGKKNGSYGRSWYYNPETLDNIKCLPTEVPEGYVKGRKFRPDNTCRSCGSDTGNKIAVFCSEKCRYYDNKKRAYELLEEYVNSNFKSINSFSKHKGIKQQNLSFLWKSNVEGYSELTKQKFRDKKCYESLLGEIESHHPYKLKSAERNREEEPQKSTRSTNSLL